MPPAHGTLAWVAQTATERGSELLGLPNDGGTDADADTADSPWEQPPAPPGAEGTGYAAWVLTTPVPPLHGTARRDPYGRWTLDDGTRTVPLCFPHDLADVLGGPAPAAAGSAAAAAGVYVDAEVTVAAGARLLVERFGTDDRGQPFLRATVLAATSLGPAAGREGRPQRLPADPDVPWSVGGLLQRAPALAAQAPVAAVVARVVHVGLREAPVAPRPATRGLSSAELFATQHVGVGRRDRLLCLRLRDMAYADTVDLYWETAGRPLPFALCPGAPVVVRHTMLARSAAGGPYLQSTEATWADVAARVHWADPAWAWLESPPLQPPHEDIPTHPHTHGRRWLADLYRDATLSTGHMHDPVCLCVSLS
jgi:hypothetical protein